MVIMKRVYTLYRVSTKGQVEKDDIPMQKAACREFAERQGWEIVKESSEKGVSGYKVAAKDRDVLQEIQRDAGLGKFDILLVFMFDRLGRRDDETPFVVEWFVKCGIDVWSVNEGQQRFDTHVDKLMNYIRYWQASGESEKTSIRTKTRMGQIVKEGWFKGGVPAFGYKLEKRGRLNKKNQPVNDIVINEEEAPVVRLVFDRYVNAGLGTHTIAGKLTSMGIKTRAGENFTAPSVRNIIKNISYLGILRSGESVSEPFEHLRIIDEVTFRRAQDIARQRTNEYEEERSIPRKTSAECLLSGNIFCGHCGGRLTASPAGGNQLLADGRTISRKHWRYVCYNRTRHRHKCPDGQTTYHAGNVEAVVESILLEVFYDIKEVSLADFMDTQYSEKMKVLQARFGKAESAFKKKMTELAALKGEIIKSIQGESSFPRDVILELIEKTTQEHEAAEKETALLAGECADTEALIQSIKAQHSQLLTWSSLYKDCEQEVKKMIISKLIDRIIVSRGNNVEIQFNISLAQFVAAGNKKRPAV